MRRGLAALVVVAMMSGCVSYGASKATATIGGSITGLGLIAVAASDGGNGQPINDRAAAFIGLVIPGILIGLGGLIGMSFHDEPPPPPEPELEPPGPDEREQAFALMKIAAQAARSGVCTFAIELEPKVRELDAIVHDELFVRDPAIKVCLAPAPVVLPAAAADSGIADPFDSPTVEPPQPAPPGTPLEATP